VSEQTDELLKLLARLIERLQRLIGELIERPEPATRDEATVVLWRLVLLALTKEVASAIEILSTVAGPETVRAITILDRSLFEYGLRLEYFYFASREAVKYFDNVRAWYAKFQRAANALTPRDTMSLKEQQRLSKLDELAKPGVEYADIRHMMAVCLKGNRFTRGDTKRYTKSLWDYYYTQGSALSHGSQGALVDFLTRKPDTGQMRFNPNSVRLTVDEMLVRVIGNLIGTITSESKHRQEDLGDAFYYRDLEFITGNWTFLSRSRPR
jgi:hypothetical protein